MGARCWEGGGVGTVFNKLSPAPGWLAGEPPGFSGSTTRAGCYQPSKACVSETLVASRCVPDVVDGYCLMYIPPFLHSPL